MAEMREEVVQLFRSRAAELLHYHVLLLHVVLGELWRVSNGAGESGEDAAVPQYVREVSAADTVYLRECRAGVLSVSFACFFLLLLTSLCR
jgi:hypothetical protein